MSNYGLFRNMTFVDVFPTSAEFLDAYDNEYIPMTLDTTDATLLYGQLVGRYGNSPIASSDLGRFQMRLFSIIYNEGPIWKKRLTLQIEIRALDSSSLIDAASGKVIQNHAENPASFVQTGTGSDTLIEKINSQTAQISKTSKLNAVAALNMLLENVTEPFLDKFAELFQAIVQPELPLLYEDVEIGG